MTTLGTPLSPSATKVMLLGSGELGKEVLIALQRLGVETIAVGRYENAPGQQVAHRAHTIVMSDPAQLKALIEAERPHLVVPEIEAIATPMLEELEAAGTVRVIPTARAARLTMDREGIRVLAADGRATAGVYSGCLVAPRWVLTAGHVAAGQPAGRLRFNLNLTGDLSHPLAVRRVVLHPNFRALAGQRLGGAGHGAGRDHLALDDAASRASRGSLKMQQAPAVAQQHAQTDATGLAGREGDGQPRLCGNDDAEMVAVAEGGQAAADAHRQTDDPLRRGDRVVGFQVLDQRWRRSRRGRR